MSVDLATLAIKVTQDGVSQAQSGLDGLTRSGANAERQMGQASTASATMAGQMMKLAAAVTAAYTAYKMLNDVINVGMRLETMNVVMNQIGKNVGISSDALKYFTEQVKSAGVTGMEAMSAISKAMVMGLNLNQMKEFTTRVRDIAVGARDAQGNLLNTSQTLQRVMHGIESGQVEILRTMGISVRSMNEVYKEYGATIGKTEKEMNTAQKAQAMLNEVMRASAPLAGAAASADETVGKQLASMARYSEEAKAALWDLFQPAMMQGVMLFTNGFKELKKWADDNRVSLGALGAQIGTYVGQVGVAGLETIKWTADNFELIRALAELYIITKAIAWLQGLTTALAASSTAATVLHGVTTGLIPVLMGAATTSTVFASGATGMATAMTSATAAGAALKAMMVTLLPSIIAVVAALGAYGAYKTFTTPGQLHGPTASGDPFADVAGGARDKDLAAAKAAEFVGPATPPPAVLQMNKIMADQQKYIDEANAAQARALAKTMEGAGKSAKGGGGGGSTDAAESAMKSFIETMKSETARAAGDTEAILGAWYSKQLLSIEKWKAAGLDTTAALTAADAAYYSKLEKLNSDFADWYNSSLGNQYERLVAEETKKLATVAGNKAKEAQVIEVYDRKHFDLSQQMETERINLFKGYLDTMAGLSPVLADQVGYKREALALELKLADAALERSRREGKISQDTYEQAQALQAVVAQAKKYNLEMENNKGISGWAYGRVKEADQRNTIKDMMGGLESGFQNAFSSGLQGVLSKDKKSLQNIGKTMFQGLIGELHKGATTKLFDSAAKMLRPKQTGIGGAGDVAGELGTAAKGLQDASVGFNLNTAQFGVAAGGLLLSGIGIATNSQALVYAGAVLQVAGLAIQLYEALTATTTVASMTTAAGALTSSASALMMAAFALKAAAGSSAGGSAGGILGGIVSVGKSLLGFHEGGIITAHGGWPLAPDERLIKAQTGERVLSRRQNRDYEAGMAGGNGSTTIHAPISVTINPRQTMTQADYNRHAKMIVKSLDQEVGRRGRKL